MTAPEWQSRLFVLRIRKHGTGSPSPSPAGEYLHTEGIIQISQMLPKGIFATTMSLIVVIVGNHTFFVIVLLIINYNFRSASESLIEEHQLIYKSIDLSINQSINQVFVYKSWNINMLIVV